MNFAGLKARVGAAVQQEHESHDLERRIVGAWIRQGVEDPGARATETTLFLIRYVEAAPELLEMTMDAAEAAGAGESLRPFFDAAVLYLEEEADFIPDEAGVAGLIDDAWLIQGLLQRLSDRHAEQTGIGLIPFDLRRANARVKSIIGDPVASQLETAVASLMALEEAEGASRRMIELITQLPLGIGDPYVEHADVEDPVLGL